MAKRTTKTTTRKSTSARSASKGVKVTGATAEEQKIVRAAKEAAREGDKTSVRRTSSPNTVVGEIEVEHTRLAEPGEGPDTRMKPEKVRAEGVLLPSPDEEHTRLATPADPEAQKIHKETMEMRKETGLGPVEKVQNAKDLPNEADSPRAKRAKQQAVFDKADEAGQAEIIAANQRTNAALGGGF